MSTKRPGWGLMLARALVRHCPRCGQGKLFRRWFTMVPTCPKCGYRFEREEGFALGASVMSLVIGQIVAVAFLIVSLVLTMPDPPVVRLVIMGVAVVLLTGLFIQPFTKTLWAAVDMLMHQTMGSSWGDTNLQPGVVEPDSLPTEAVASEAVPKSPEADASRGS
jgi:uncharacterized protein (DUF983 family)